MKNKLFILSSFIFFTAFSYYLSQKESTQLTDIISANIEALAQDENEKTDWWTQPETRRCKHDLGGGWFESSVERICTFCATPNSCTPVECGEVFY